MRTTLDLDEVVLSAGRAKARADGTSLGRAISDLALAGLTRPTLQQAAADGDELLVLRGVPGHLVTDDLVAAHRDDD
ncbi:hypothetical protein [Nostocoides vanveenii]|jgi:hypothetical protein|uniref:DUF2191 domain-containing protein n=1 Tax=Nostocoides vanveenii TaxID=330835 RepID=A0ABN2JYL3_9MICO